ncbi:MAG: hypothetical protein II180_14425, partial [Proteobacteria bacterium]|nr:hypothetical protein [Pseudomonadota bacterium]
GNYGTRDSNNLYRTSQTISRVKYEDFKTHIPSDIQEHYTIPNLWNFQPALDVPNKRMAVWGQSKNGKTRHLYIYNLSNAKKLTPKSKQLSFPLTWGAGTSDYPEETGVRPTVKVKDLSELDPVWHYEFTDSSTIYSDDIQQGFAIKNGKIYILTGGGNDNDGNSASYANVTIMNFSGASVKKYALPAVSNMRTLKDLGITSTGYLEAEGIRMIDGCLYIAFTSIDTDNVRRVVVLRYDLMQE